MPTRISQVQYTVEDAGIVQVAVMTKPHPLVRAMVAVQRSGDLPSGPMGQQMQVEGTRTVILKDEALVSQILALVDYAIEIEEGRK